MSLHRLVLRLFEWLYALISALRMGRIIGKIPIAVKFSFFIWSKLAPRYVFVGGNKIYLDASPFGLCRELLVHGVYEKGTTRLFKQLVKDGSVVVDAGANIGYFTLLAARLVGKTGRVFAFEPALSNYDLLVKNIEENRYETVTPVKKAVSNKTGVTELFLDGLNMGSNTIYCPGKFGKSVPVDTVTLDEFFKDRESPIDLIKMDIEGAEMAALEGMANIIKKNDNLRIITEFVPHRLIEAGVSPESFLNLITDYGFSIYVIDEDEESIQPVSIVQVLETWNVETRRNFLLEKS